MRLALPALALLGACAGLVPFPLPMAQREPAPTIAAARPALTVLLAGSVPRPDEARAAILRALGKSFDVAFVEPPSRPPRAADTAPIEEDLAAARKAYVAADFTPCLARTGELARVTDLLAQGERALAGRLLFWRIACRVGGGRLEDARRDAETFAVLELDPPADVEAAAPDVEALVAEAARRVAALPRHPLRVTAAAPAGRPPPPAAVSIDGRPRLCATPCAIDLPAGDHAVRVDADGYAPQARVARLEEPGGAVAFVLAAADPALAAEQWTARHAGAAVDSAASMALLATALRARSLAVIAAEPAPKGTRLVGTLAVDGAVASRSERVAAGDAEAAATAPALLRDLLLRGRLLDAAPPLHRRPVFWVTVGLAAVAAAAVTAALLWEPDRTVEVRL
jgi:hypothetical protein